MLWSEKLNAAAFNISIQAADGVVGIGSGTLNVTIATESGLVSASNTGSGERRVTLKFIPVLMRYHRRNNKPNCPIVWDSGDNFRVAIDDAYWKC